MSNIAVQVVKKDSEIIDISMLGHIRIAYYAALETDNKMLIHLLGMAMKEYENSYQKLTLPRS